VDLVSRPWWPQPGRLSGPLAALPSRSDSASPPQTPEVSPAASACAAHSPPDRAAPADRLRRRLAGGPVRPALAVRGKNRAGSAPGRRPPAASPSARIPDRAAGRDASWRPSPVSGDRWPSGFPRPLGSLPWPTRRRGQRSAVARELSPAGKADQDRLSAFVDAVLGAVPAAVNEPVNPATGQVGGLA